MYEKLTNSAEEVAEIRSNYAAFVAMSDDYFGKLLDRFDEECAWKNTALFLTTDHGFLLGEHEWWAKNKMPYYEEISHMPLMLWHPNMKDSQGKEVNCLIQTTDLMPMIVDMFGIEAPNETTSYSVLPFLNREQGERETAILGMFAGPICVTEGRYTYFRFPASLEGAQLPAYTLMPSHLENLFSKEEMCSAQFVDPFDFTKGPPLMRITLDPEIGETVKTCVADWNDGSCLFDLENDPRQLSHIDDEHTINRFLTPNVVHLR